MARPLPVQMRSYRAWRRAVLDLGDEVLGIDDYTNRTVGTQRIAERLASLGKRKPRFLDKSDPLVLALATIGEILDAWERAEKAEHDIEEGTDALDTYMTEVLDEEEW